MGLKIGEVAKRGGVSLQAVRYYEREGLLPKPPRLESGYRMFPESTVRRIWFIKSAHNVGFSLSEIRELLLLREDDDGGWDLHEFATDKVVSIEEQIQKLEVMKDFLNALAECCPHCGPLSECPILNLLETGGTLN